MAQVKNSKDIHDPTAPVNDGGDAEGRIYRLDIGGREFRATLATIEQAPQGSRLRSTVEALEKFMKEHSSIEKFMKEHSSIQDEADILLSNSMQEKFQFYMQEAANRTERLYESLKMNGAHIDMDSLICEVARRDKQLSPVLNTEFDRIREQLVRQ
jgi:cell fate (sporulation/competence/biofilm development) regulator YlbF (YheA/YmcA/DUF963 family)